MDDEHSHQEVKGQGSNDNLNVTSSAGIGVMT